MEQASVLISALALGVALLAFWRTALVQDQTYAREASSRHTELTKAAEEVLRNVDRAKAVYKSFWALARTYDPTLPASFADDEKNFQGAITRSNAALEIERSRQQGNDPLDEDKKLRTSKESCTIPGHFANRCQPIFRCFNPFARRSSLATRRPLPEYAA